MTVEANVWNKNNSAWREIVDSASISVNVATNHQVSFTVTSVPANSVSTGSIQDDAVTNAKLADEAKTVNLQILIDGNGSVITTGVKGYFELPFAGTITAARLVADQSGSMVVDVWVDSFANFPPDNADSITSSTPPTLSAAQTSEDTTLTSWTTSFSAGDWVGFNVDSASSVTQATLSLTVVKT